MFSQFSRWALVFTTALSVLSVYAKDDPPTKKWNTEVWVGGGRYVSTRPENQNAYSNPGRDFIQVNYGMSRAYQNSEIGKRIDTQTTLPSYEVLSSLQNEILTNYAKDSSAPQTPAYSAWMIESAAHYQVLLALGRETHDQKWTDDAVTSYLAHLGKEISFEQQLQLAQVIGYHFYARKAYDGERFASGGSRSLATLLRVSGYETDDISRIESGVCGNIHHHINQGILRAMNPDQNGAPFLFTLSYATLNSQHIISMIADPKAPPGSKLYFINYGELVEADTQNPRSILQSLSQIQGFDQLGVRVRIFATEGSIDRHIATLLTDIGSQIAGLALENSADQPLAYQNSERSDRVGFAFSREYTKKNGKYVKTRIGAEYVDLNSGGESLALLISRRNSRNETPQGEPIALRKSTSSRTWALALNGADPAGPNLVQGRVVVIGMQRWSTRALGSETGNVRLELRLREEGDTAIAKGATDRKVEGIGDGDFSAGLALVTRVRSPNGQFALKFSAAVETAIGLRNLLSIYDLLESPGKTVSNVRLTPNAVRADLTVTQRLSADRPYPALALTGYYLTSAVGARGDLALHLLPNAGDRISLGYHRPALGWQRNSLMFQDETIEPSVYGQYQKSIGQRSRFQLGVRGDYFTDTQTPYVGLRLRYFPTR